MAKIRTARPSPFYVALLKKVYCYWENKDNFEGVYIVDWKLWLATLWSGDWWLWFIEAFRLLSIQSVASVCQGIWKLACNKGVGFIALSMIRKTKCPNVQIIVEQWFHYTAKMTSSKHFPNTIFANRNTKLERFFTCSGQQRLLRSQHFHGG